MRINFLLVKIILVLAQSSFASTLLYFQEISKTSGAEALKKHNYILETSNNLRFLDCPIELIERQWDGLESVIVGINYLQEFIKESGFVKPDYQAIYQRCLSSSYEFHNRERLGSAKGRYITYNEKRMLARKISNSALINLIYNKLNQDTLCYTKHQAIHLGAFIAGSIGRYQIECFTPLGRRFKLKGLSFGMGLGVGAAISLPSIKPFKDKLAYRLKLFFHPDKAFWYDTHMATTYAIGPGIIIEDQPYSVEKGSIIGPKGTKPSVGASICVEDLYNIMRQKFQSPFYMSLVEAKLLENFENSTN